jgi:hypothetical protein
MFGHSVGLSKIEVGYDEYYEQHWKLYKNRKLVTRLTFACMRGVVRSAEVNQASAIDL